MKDTRQPIDQVIDEALKGYEKSSAENYDERVMGSVMAHIAESERQKSVALERIADSFERISEVLERISFKR